MIARNNLFVKLALGLYHKSTSENIVAKLLIFQVALLGKVSLL